MRYELEHDSIEPPAQRNTPVERYPHRLIIEVRNLRKQAHHAEVVAYIAVSMAGGTVAGLVLAVTVWLLRH